MTMTLYSNCTGTPKTIGLLDACHYGWKHNISGNPCTRKPTKGPPLNRVPSTLNVKLGNTTREVIWRIENQDDPTLPAVQSIGNLKFFRVKGPCNCRAVARYPGTHHSSICPAKLDSDKVTCNCGRDVPPNRYGSHHTETCPAWSED